jgi:uncharacterized ferredoxin-like protein
VSDAVRRQDPGSAARRETQHTTCNLRDIGLGIVLGSAVKTAAIHWIDGRCRTRIATATGKSSGIRGEVIVGLGPG